MDFLIEFSGSCAVLAVLMLVVMMVIYSSPEDVPYLFWFLLKSITVAGVLTLALRVIIWIWS